MAAAAVRLRRTETVVATAVRQPGDAVKSHEEHPFFDADTRLFFGQQQTFGRGQDVMRQPLWRWQEGERPPLGVDKTWNNTVWPGGGPLAGRAVASTLCRAQWRGGRRSGNHLMRRRMGARLRRGWWAGGSVRTVGVREARTGMEVGLGLAAGLCTGLRGDDDLFW